MTIKKTYYENTLSNYPEVLTIKDVQVILNIGYRKVKKMLLQGDISYFKSGSHYKIPKYELISFLENPK